MMAERTLNRTPRRLVEALRNETIGGALLLAAAAIALIWANSPWSTAYVDLTELEVGPAALHLHLSLATWAGDGLLAVFFFVAGVELKYELVMGSLRRASTALVPVAAALGGMAIPALIFVVINLSLPDGQPSGWGIPMATDIAFALAVLAVAGRNLPVEVRIFLLTLAVVDDLGAIIVIALFYTSSLSILPLLGAVLVIAAYGFAQQQRIRSPFLYIPLALVAWVLVHDSGIHATVAGIALGLLTRAKPDPGEQASPAERMEHLIGPFSAGFCVPVFAFMSAGVVLIGSSFGQVFPRPVVIGIIVGLVVGKPIGVVLGAWLVQRFSRAQLADVLGFRDVWAIGLVAGVGFTVSLLITELAFEGGPALMTQAKVGVLAASIIASTVASLALMRRGRHHDAQSG